MNCAHNGCPRTIVSGAHCWLHRERNWSTLPRHCVPGLKRWLEHGVQPGGFLSAVLCNNFSNVVFKSDQRNAGPLLEYAIFLWHDMPLGSWGSVDRCQAWAAQWDRRFVYNEPYRSVVDAHYVKQFTARGGR